MSQKHNYFISIHGVRVPVSQQVYETYHKTARRIRYYEHDIKVGRVRKKDGKEKLLPSKEDSYDRLDLAGGAPATGVDDVVNEVVAHLTRQRLYDVLRELPQEEFNILVEIFWNEKSERALSTETGIPQKTINDRKRRILQKLKKKLYDLK